MLPRVGMTVNVSVTLIRALASSEHYRIQIKSLSLMLLPHCTPAQQSGSYPGTGYFLYSVPDALSQEYLLLACSPAQFNGVP